MEGIRTLLHEVHAQVGQLPAVPSIRPRHTLTVTGCVSSEGYVCLRYVVTPAPEELPADTVAFQREAGIAVDDHARVYRDCSVAYRRSDDGLRVEGTFQVAPLLLSGTGTLRVLFPPLALTPELEHALCEAELACNGDRVELLSIRWA